MPASPRLCHFCGDSLLRSAGRAVVTAAGIVVRCDTCTETGSELAQPAAMAMRPKSVRTPRQLPTLTSAARAAVPSCERSDASESIPAAPIADDVSQVAAPPLSTAASAVLARTAKEIATRSAAVSIRIGAVLFAITRAIALRVFDALAIATVATGSFLANPRRTWSRRTQLLSVPAAVCFGLLSLSLSFQNSFEEMPALAVDIDLAQTDVSTAPFKRAAPELPRAHSLSAGSLAHADAVELSLLTWYHPLAGSIRYMPAKNDRRFGARRPGTRPAECRGGHCGVDLANQRGIVVHAVRPGTLVRVQRTVTGRAGYYVRIRHAEGFVTSYMHLDHILPSLVEGMDVAGGEPLGVIGRSGTKRSAPHLHFSVSKIQANGTRRYVDPEPMLAAATLLDEPAPYPEYTPLDMIESDSPAPLSPADRARVAKAPPIIAPSHTLDVTADSASSAAEQIELEIEYGDEEELEVQEHDDDAPATAARAKNASQGSASREEAAVR